jgi:hypothetical protein
MPRSSWSSSPKSSKPAVSRAASVPVTVTTPVPAASAVQHNVKVDQPGFFSNIWQGFGLGAGQAIAHNIFRSDPVVKHVHEDDAPVPLVNELPKEFVQCMKDNHNDTDLCKQFLK